MEKSLEYIAYIVLAIIVVGLMAAYSARLYGDKYFNAKKTSIELSLIIDSISNFPSDIKTTVSFPKGYDIVVDPPCEISVYIGDKLYAKDKCILYEFDKRYFASTPFLIIEKQGGEITIQ